MAARQGTMSTETGADRRTDWEVCKSPRGQQGATISTNSAETGCALTILTGFLSLQLFVAIRRSSLAAGTFVDRTFP